MLTPTISTSIIIPKGCTITEITCEILPTENVLVKNVQYQKINEKIDIVDSVSRRSIFNLNANPNVLKINKPDFGLVYYIKYREPGNETTSMYRIDPDSLYVYKTSHLAIKYIVEDGEEYAFVISGSKNSYLSILKYLQENYKEETMQVFIKVGEDFMPFSELDPKILIPEESVEILNNEIN